MFDQDVSIAAIFIGEKYWDVPFPLERPQRSVYLSSVLIEAATLVIHMLSQEILNLSTYMLGCKVALDQDLSIGSILRRKNYLDVPLILSTGPNSMYLFLLLVQACLGLNTGDRVPA